MKSIKEIAAQAVLKWGDKTLIKFRDEARKESNGTVFESLKAEDGPRLMIIVCVTDPEQIDLLSSIIKFSEEVSPADWNSLTLAEMMMRTDAGVGLSYEDLRNESGTRIAVTLCATKPETVRTIETIFAM